MTQTWTKTLTDALLIVAVAVATLAGLALIGQAQAADQQVSAPAVAEQMRALADELPGLEGTEYLSRDQRLAAEASADRICEGARAGVPVMAMADTLAAEAALSDEQARTWVNQVLTGGWCTR